MYKTEIAFVEAVREKIMKMLLGTLKIYLKVF